MTPVLSPEEIAERLRRLYAEAGYPDVIVRLAPSQWPQISGLVAHLWGTGGIPYEIRWRAAVLSGYQHVACFTCFRWTRENGLRGVVYADCPERGLGTDDCGSDRSDWFPD